MVGSTPRRWHTARLAASAAALIVAAALLVAAVGTETDAGTAAELKALTPKQADNLMINHMALTLLKSSVAATDAQLDQQVGGWAAAVKAAALMQLQNPAAAASAHMQMLAMPPSSMLAAVRGRKSGGQFGGPMLADGESALCAKKGRLIETLDKLLAKLGVNVAKMNFTMDQVSQEFKDSVTAWLDAESAYRLSVQTAKEAAQGAAFATEEYEKWSEAHKDSKKTRDATLKQHAEERTELLNEKEVIKQIMRLIGVYIYVKTHLSVGGGEWGWVGGLVYIYVPV
jgi:hypothetical protein